MLDILDIFLGKGGRGSGHLSKYGEWGIVDMADHESAHTPTSLPEYIFLLQLYLHSTCLISYSVLTFDILTRPLPRQCCIGYKWEYLFVSAIFKTFRIQFNSHSANVQNIIV